MTSTLNSVLLKASGYNQHFPKVPTRQTSRKASQSNPTKLSYCSNPFENKHIIIYSFPTVRIAKFHFSSNHSNFSLLIRGKFYLTLPYLDRMLQELIAHLFISAHGFAYLSCLQIFRPHKINFLLMCIQVHIVRRYRHNYRNTWDCACGGHRITSDVISPLLIYYLFTYCLFFEAESLTGLELTLCVSLPVSPPPVQGYKPHHHHSQLFCMGNRGQTQSSWCDWQALKNWAISQALIINFLMSITLTWRPNFLESKYTVFAVSYHLGQVIQIFWSLINSARKW